MTAQARDSRETARYASVRLPERLAKRSRITMAVCDAAVTLFVSFIILGNPANGAAAAFVAAAILCGCVWYCGLYRRSFAVCARDEAYYVMVAAALSAIPMLLILSGVAEVPLLHVAAILIFSTVAIGGIHVALHIERRGRGTQYAGIDSITPLAWHARESTAYRLGKRVFDVTIAVVILVLAAPVMIVAAIAIIIESGAPVFFVQQRVGESCLPFRIFKFRTMRVGAGAEWAKPGDDRITRVGAFLRRTSLDELPQLFNVLRGDMALVGPRPEMASFAKQFAAQLPAYDQRHVVAPGVTGWAQVYLKRNLQPGDMPEVLPYDLFYVEHASRLLDCVIILKTAAEVLFHGAV